MNKRINPEGYGIPEAKARYLMPGYEPFFAPLVGKGITLLELGIQEGASLRFWRDYLENATIVGLDSNPVNISDSTGMIHVYQGYQEDAKLLDRIAAEQAPDGFDVVIDDCSHIGKLARISFYHIFQNHLKPGGMYAIEDWGTGYWPWPKWPDGGRYKPKSLLYSRKNQVQNSFRQRSSRIFPRFPRITGFSQRLFIGSTIPSHTHGMVGFAKELFDLCSLGATAIPKSGSGRYIGYGISQLHINTWLIVAIKTKRQDVWSQSGG